MTEGKADSIMCVYNAVNGVPGCASTDLLQKRLRDQWGFEGYVVSDCGAIGDIYRNHKYVRHAGCSVGRGRQGGHGPDLRQRVQEPGRRGEGRHHHGSRDHPVRRAAVRRALPSRHVRSAGARAVREDPVLRERLGAAPGAGARGRAGGHRAPEEPGRRPAAAIRRSARSPSSAPRRTTRSGCSATTTASRPGRSRPLEGHRAAVPRSRRCSTPSARTTRPPRRRWCPPNVLTPPDGKGPGLLAEYFDNADLQGEPKLRRTEPRVYFEIAHGRPGRSRGRQRREVLHPLDRRR